MASRCGRTSPRVIAGFADQLGALGYDLTQIITSTLPTAATTSVPPPRPRFGAGTAATPLDPALRPPATEDRRAGFGTGQATAVTDPALRQGTPKTQYVAHSGRPRYDVEIPTLSTAAVLGPGRLEALRAVHIPAYASDATTGRDRLVYDELLRMQLAMGVQRNAARQHPAVVHAPTGRLTRPWLESLPLTGAQNRVLSEIAADLRSSAPMKQLLQGDVGAGKTAVAICAMLQAAEGGHQAALLSHVGVLVQQLRGNRRICEKLGLRAVFVPSMNAPAREKLVSKVPQRKTGQPEDIAEAAAYLCSPAAGYVSGVVLDVDGGLGIGSSIR